MKILFLGLTLLLSSAGAFAQEMQEIAVISLNPGSSNPRLYIDVPTPSVESSDGTPKAVWKCTVKANDVAIKTFIATTDLNGSNPEGNYNYTTNVPGVKLTTSCKKTMSIIIK